MQKSGGTYFENLEIKDEKDDLDDNNEDFKDYYEMQKDEFVRPRENALKLAAGHRTVVTPIFRKVVLQPPNPTTSVSTSGPKVLFPVASRKYVPEKSISHHPVSTSFPYTRIPVAETSRVSVDQYGRYNGELPFQEKTEPSEMEKCQNLGIVIVKNNGRIPVTKISRISAHKVSLQPGSTSFLKTPVAETLRVSVDQHGRCNGELPFQEKFESPEVEKYQNLGNIPYQFLDGPLPVAKTSPIFVDQNPSSSQNVVHSFPARIILKKNKVGRPPKNKVVKANSSTMHKKIYGSLMKKHYYPMAPDEYPIPGTEEGAMAAEQKAGKVAKAKNARKKRGMLKLPDLGKSPKDKRKVSKQQKLNQPRGMDDNEIDMLNRYFYTLPMSSDLANNIEEQSIYSRQFFKVDASNTPLLIHDMRQEIVTTTYEEEIVKKEAVDPNDNAYGMGPTDVVVKTEIDDVDPCSNYGLVENGADEQGVNGYSGEMMGSANLSHYFSTNNRSEVDERDQYLPGNKIIFTETSREAKENELCPCSTCSVNGKPGKRTRPFRSYVGLRGRCLVCNAFKDKSFLVAYTTASNFALWTDYFGGKRFCSKVENVPHHQRFVCSDHFNCSSFDCRGRLRHSELPINLAQGLEKRIEFFEQLGHDYLGVSDNYEKKYCRLPIMARSFGQSAIEVMAELPKVKVHSEALRDLLKVCPMPKCDSKCELAWKNENEGTVLVVRRVCSSGHTSMWKTRV